MAILICVILSFAVLMILGISSASTSESNNNEEKHLYISMIDYVGGNDKIVSQVKTIMKMYRTGIEVTFCKGVGTIKETIPFQNVTSIDILIKNNYPQA